MKNPEFVYLRALGPDFIMVPKQSSFYKNYIFLSETNFFVITYNTKKKNK